MKLMRMLVETSLTRRHAGSVTGARCWTSPRSRADAAGSSGSGSWTSSLLSEKESVVNVDSEAWPPPLWSATSCLSSWLSIRTRSRAPTSSPSFRLLWRISLMYSQALDRIPPLL